MLARDTLAHAPQAPPPSCAERTFADVGSDALRSRESIAADRVFSDELVALIPSLRSFARSLCGSRDMADDLVQDAMMRGWAARARYEPDTNLKAWMFRILRNHFYSVFRRDRRMVGWDPELAERVLVEAPAQQDAIHIADVAKALKKLPFEQREVLMLVGASGLAYDEAAEIVGCAIGTLKSRLCRGRRALAILIDGPQDASLFDRQATRAAA